MRKPEHTLAALGLVIAILALIPAFGQWLFPRDPVPVAPTPTSTSLSSTPLSSTPLLATPEATPSATLATVATPSEVPPLPEASQSESLATPTMTTFENLSPASYIAAECEATQYLAIDLPSSPIIEFYETNPQRREDVQLVKELIVLSMQLAIQAAADQDARCLGEIFDSLALGEVEGTLANFSSTGFVTLPRIEWSLSRLLDYERKDLYRLEASVCLVQSLDVYTLQGTLIITYPADVVAASYVFEQANEDGRYYTTLVLELDPLAFCQY